MPKHQLTHIRPDPKEWGRVRYLLSVGIVLLVGFMGGHTAAQDVANCKVEAPVEKFPLMAGDFPPNGPWMTKRMIGMTLKYENGMTEKFNKDGTYEVQKNGETRIAPNYRLYSASISGNDGGFVCIGFQEIQFQRYVVNKTELTRIDGSGERWVATISPTGPTAQDFVRSQAAKAAFVTDLATINRHATDMFRVASFAVMRMTHQDWVFEIDTTIKNSGQTYAWKVRSNAEDGNYDVRRFEAALSRNKVVGEDARGRAQEFVDLVDQLAQHSMELAELYGKGDATSAGDHYHAEIVPVYEAIRSAEATINSMLAREIKNDAAFFKP